MSSIRIRKFGSHFNSFVGAELISPSGKEDLHVVLRFSSRENPHFQVTMPDGEKLLAIASTADEYEPGFFEKWTWYLDRPCGRCRCCRCCRMQH